MTVGAVRLLLALLLLISNLTNTLADTETCELNQDGTCVEEAVTSKTTKTCKDGHEQCNHWSSLGECKANPQYMLTHCQESCKVCDSSKSLAEMIDEAWKELRGGDDDEDGEPDINETPYGVKQEIMKDKQAEIEELLKKTEKYVEEVVNVDPAYVKVRPECKNRHKHCSWWQTLGECEANPKYMLLHCAPSCQTCDKIDFDTRCPWNKEETPNVFEPGDLNRMFERITTEEYYQQYKPVIHMQPPEGPWVVTMDNFLTDEECERLIELGGEQGYEISKDVGAKKFDGTYDAFQNTGRTSTNAWCVEECYEDNLTKAVLERIENVTGVPDKNSEYLQLLRYEKTQHYNVHNDFIPHQVKREEGVRILTVFLYLSDVEAGGGTNFPHLNITVYPKRGKVLIWPSVLNEDPNKKDRRTDHQALPVEKGLKFAANAWLHMRDFKGPYERGCT